MRLGWAKRSDVPQRLPRRTLSKQSKGTAMLLSELRQTLPLTLVHRGCTSCRTEFPYYYS